MVQIKLFIFILCTALSGYGIIGSVHFIAPLFTEEWGKETPISILVLISWLSYFYLAKFWIFSVPPPKYIVIIGTICGCICIIGSFGMALLITFPAVILALYMCGFADFDFKKA